MLVRLVVLMREWIKGIAFLSASQCRRNRRVMAFRKGSVSEPAVGYEGSRFSSWVFTTNFVLHLKVSSPGAEPVGCCNCAVSCAFELSWPWDSFIGLDRWIEALGWSGSCLTKFCLFRQNSELRKNDSVMYRQQPGKSEKVACTKFFNEELLGIKDLYTTVWQRVSH